MFVFYPTRRNPPIHMVAVRQYLW